MLCEESGEAVLGDEGEEIRWIRDDASAMEIGRSGTVSEAEDGGEIVVLRRSGEASRSLRSFV